MTLDSLRYPQRQRMQFIALKLNEQGYITRSDLIGSHFAIGPAQASNDFRTFEKLYPDAMRYDPRQKRYIAIRECEVPEVVAEPVQLRSIKLTKSEWERALTLGDGNASEGIRRALAKA